MYSSIHLRLYVVFQEQHFQQDLVEFEHEKQVAEVREKSTPEKVKIFLSYLVRYQFCRHLVFVLRFHKQKTHILS